jgi:hypothetical protein
MKKNRRAKPTRLEDQLALAAAGVFLPTTRHSDAGRGGRGDLIQALRGNPNRHYLPTLIAADAKGSLGKHRGDGRPKRNLAQVLTGNMNKHYLPTTAATEYGSNQGGAAGRVGPKRPSLRGHLGGSPNPDWLDWYVGLPIGWSALKPLATSRFQWWLKQHGSA